MTQVERVAEMLFPEEGARTLNVKFLCAGQAGVSAETLAGVILRAEVQIRGNAATAITDVDSHLTAR